MGKEPLAPGATIGILGGGQLGRMLCVASANLGFNTHIFCDQKNQPAEQLATRTTIAPYDDLDALKAFSNDVDVATFEFENIPTEALEYISSHTRLAPGSNALKATRDRLVEKEFIQSLGIPVAPFIDIKPGVEPDFDEIANKIKYPAILKTRRFGYDGKGQIKCENAGDLANAIQAFNGAPAILEEMIRFERELSTIATREENGKIQFYDLTENVHEGGILQTSTVPANADPNTTMAAQTFARAISDELEYVGTFAIEYFYCGENENLMLIVNEIAPRVHNSGHWTLDASHTSQFENHIRAIARWPLGSTIRHSNAVMTNLIGDDLLKWPELVQTPENAVHIYGKEEIRNGRKMAHVTHLSSKKAE